MIFYILYLANRHITLFDSKSVDKSVKSNTFSLVLAIDFRLKGVMCRFAKYIRCKMSVLRYRMQYAKCDILRIYKVHLTLIIIMTFFLFNNISSMIKSQFFVQFYYKDRSHFKMEEKFHLTSNKQT